MFDAVDFIFLLPFFVINVMCFQIFDFNSFKCNSFIYAQRSEVMSFQLQWEIFLKKCFC